MTSALQPVAEALAQGFRPLRLALEDATGTGFARLLRELGWDVALDAGVLGRLEVATRLPRLVESAEAAARRLASGGSDHAALVVEVLDLVLGPGGVVAELEALASDPPTHPSVPALLRDQAFWTDLASVLPEYLLFRYLEVHQPLLYGAVRVLGLYDDLETTRTGAYPDHYVPFRARSLRLARLFELFADPLGYLSTRYGWTRTGGASAFGHESAAALLAEIETALCSLGVPVRRAAVRSRFRGPGQPFAADSELLAHVQALEIPLVSGRVAGGWTEQGLTVFPVPARPRDEVTAGLYVGNLSSGAAPATVGIGRSWALDLESTVDGTGAIGLALAPGVAPVLVADGAADAVFAVTIRPGPQIGQFRLFGGETGTRLLCRGVEASAALRVKGGAPDLVLGLAAAAGAGADPLTLILEPGEGDAFVAELLGRSPLEVPMQAAVEWSARAGLTVHGGVGFELTIPIDKSLGPVFLDAVTVAIQVGSDGAALEAGLTAAAALGPFAVVVDGVGLRTELSSAGDGVALARFGDLDLAIAFKPPSGLGLALDAGVVTGGGFVSHDPDLGRYAGAAELAILNTGIAAVGVLLTRIEGAPDAWSMFMSLGARFVGVQLGFGFTLNGVGGLVGIHRGLDDDALGDAVRTGSLGAILFPEDPVADAPRILAEIDAIFPPVPDQYVFGPVVKIGWGTPTLVELDVGVAIQLPEPLTISLLGALEAILPDEAAPVLELNAAFAGTVNLTEGTLKIDASLSGSKVAGFLITGDMSVRMEFHGQPSFLVAFGGFHPAFDPPACFPRLERLAISLDAGDMLQLGLGGYFALTSNSIQFGAFAYFRISEAGFTAEGGASFDALIIYRRFGFTIGLSVWVSIAAGQVELLCVRLTGDLTGPNPWHLVAEASFKLLGIKQSIELELSFGERESQAAVEEVDVQALLEQELMRDDAWSVLSPAGDVPVIVATDAEVPALDPAGRVQVGQRIVPLDRAIERYGNADLAGEETFSIAVQDFAADELEDLEDWFGSEHYFRLDQDERLSAPSFTLMKAGVIVGGARAAAPPARSMIYDHEIAYKDPKAEVPRRRPLAVAGAATLERALAMRSSGATRVEFGVRDAAYAVCDARTGRVARGTRAGADFFTARAALATAARDGSMVIPAYELELLA